MPNMIRVGIDAHKRNCTTCVFDNDGAENQVLDSPTNTFVFNTTHEGVQEFMEKVPENSVVVIETSTTGKVLSKMLSSRYDIHLVAPPERRPQIKTDRRDAVRIVKEDMLGYLRRCYNPSPYIEEMRTLVGQQMDLGAKISRVKNQVHALLERNMVQSEFSGLSDLFGVEGLRNLSKIEFSSKQDMIELGMYLSELKLYAALHRQIETEIAQIADSGKDCQLLMSHPGISSFTAVAIKARVGDASRFPTKKHLCSYAGVVPKAANSGEYVSEHSHVKHGDDVLKYALTCAVRGAVRANADSTVKKFYNKQIERGMDPKKAEVAAARKLACIVWKILTSKQRYPDEDEYLTKKKTRETTSKARRVLRNPVEAQKVLELIESLSTYADVLERYPEDRKELG
jgi:transposase